MKFESCGGATSAGAGAGAGAGASAPGRRATCLFAPQLVGAPATAASVPGWVLCFSQLAVAHASEGWSFGGVSHAEVL